jgi:diguanylate cyclase (GGDEF)-like protein
MPASKPNILLVDDDPALLRLLTKWLEIAGYSVRCAMDGRVAMAAIESDCPSVLVTDWGMPNVDGLELCHWLRAQKLPHYVYTIFLTIRRSVQDLVQGLRAGADDFVRKPVNREELLARLSCGVRALERESRLVRLAKCDPLTDLPTRRTLYEEAEREWERACRHHFPLSCVMMDLDFFKRINDTYGHPIGDEVLRQVAALLARNIRITDLVCRYGGEEFCMFLPETNEHGGTVWAEHTRELLARTMIVAGERQITLTASLGVASRTPETTSPQELIDLADQALLQAKRLGRNRVVAYQEVDDSAAVMSDVLTLDEMLGHLRARDIMGRIACTVQPDDALPTAAARLLEQGVDLAPVVDTEQRLVGVLSEQDVLAALSWSNRDSATVRKAMNTDVVTFDEWTPVSAVYETLCRCSIRHALILSNDLPAGIINHAVLLRWFVQHSLCEF